MAILGMLSRTPSTEAADGSKARSQDANPVSLKDAVQFALDEARMILPGIQALFGFQLIAVFNQRFDEVLAGPQRVLFLVALLLVAVACALVMTPAAYHREVERQQVSERLLVLTSRCLAAALWALMLAIACDVYLVTWVTIGSAPVALTFALGIGAIYALLWYVLPLAIARRRDVV